MVHEERFLETISPDYHRHFNCHQFHLICTIMRKINLIVIHCSATRSNQSFTVEDLRACHNAESQGRLSRRQDPGSPRAAQCPQGLPVFPAEQGVC